MAPVAVDRRRSRRCSGRASPAEHGLEPVPPRRRRRRVAAALTVEPGRSRAPAGNRHRPLTTRVDRRWHRRSRDRPEPRGRGCRRSRLRAQLMLTPRRPPLQRLSTRSSSGRRYGDRRRRVRTARRATPGDQLDQLSARRSPDASSSPTTRPSRRTVIRSATASTSCSLWRDEHDRLAVVGAVAGSPVRRRSRLALGEARGGLVEDQHALSFVRVVQGAGDRRPSPGRRRARSPTRVLRPDRRAGSAAASPRSVACSCRRRIRAERVRSGSRSAAPKFSPTLMSSKSPRS